MTSHQYMEKIMINMLYKHVNQLDMLGFGQNPRI